ncbi:MAG: DNA replication and repair protein RecF [Treponema sp.]|jgi:DNA replication and repair protein RecF|nr:DNA replication and repair protein RecF [Treponema sp.]
MIFSSLRTAFFRNLADDEVFTGAKDVFLIGENGQGKTNFLEALYFCAYASSFRGARDTELARNGEKDFSASVKIAEAGDGEKNNAPRGMFSEILVKFEKGKKNVLIDGKRVEDRKDLLSVAPCIVFCHEDMEFVAGSPEQRRWFFDQALSLYDPVYLDDLRRYRRVLKSRNTVLRDYVLRRLAGSPEPLLDALDLQYVQYGIKLMEKRETAARLFSGVFGPLYEEVSGIAGIMVRYAPSWKAGTADSAADSEDEAGMEAQVHRLRERRASDLAAGISLSGPHRDRYAFTRDGAEFAGKASTGQRRLLALLLRVAQARRFFEMTGKNPVLLLDDVLLEMDGEKRRRFLSVLPGYDQAFYTFLPEEPFRRYRKADTLVYQVEAGRIFPAEAGA